MNILHILPSNHVGGPNLRILSIVKEIESGQFHGVIISPKDGGDFAGKVLQNGITAYQVTMPGPKHFTDFKSILGNVKWFFTMPMSILSIIKIIRREKIDIVHIQGLLNFPGSLAARLTRKKVVWHLIGSVYPDNLVYFLMPLVILLSDHMIFIGKKLAHYYLQGKQENQEDKFTIIYNGINTTLFNQDNINEENINRLRDDFNIKSNEKIIGCVGNVNPAKGYEYLINAALIVKNRFPDAKFIIVGGIIPSQTNYYQKLKDMIKKHDLDKNFIFTGKRDDVDELLSLFDVFVLPSIAEGTPMVILEAMAMGKPIIATDVGAVSEQIIDNHSGILVKPKSPEELAQSIEYLLGKENKAFILGKNAKNRVSKLFSIKTSSEKYKQLYQSLMS